MNCCGCMDERHFVRFEGYAGAGTENVVATRRSRRSIYTRYLCIHADWMATQLNTHAHFYAHNCIKTLKHFLNHIKFHGILTWDGGETNVLELVQFRQFWMSFPFDKISAMAHRKRPPAEPHRRKKWRKYCTRTPSPQKFCMRWDTKWSGARASPPRSAGSNFMFCFFF